MANKTQTLRPGDPDDLICDTCPERWTFRGSVTRTHESARVAGWHIFTEENRPPRKLCPTCIGTPRTRAPKVDVMDGQADMLADLAQTMNYVVVRAEKKKKGKGGREMS